MRYLQCLAITFLFTITATAQALPKTQLYSFNVQGDSEKGFMLNSGKLLTSFNSKGYNNQPFVTDDGKLYYSIRLSDMDQNDIYVLDLRSAQRYRFTATNESEYSPWVDPVKGVLYCIRVNENSTPKQQLWAYPLDRSDSGKPVWRTDMEAGYFCPANDSLMAVFTLNDNEGGDLQIVNTNSGEANTIAENIGRTLKPDENGDIFFLHRASDELQYLKLYEVREKRAKVLTRMNMDINDFAYHQGLIWFAEGSRIMVFNPDAGLKREIADLAIYDINGITRLFLYDNSLILVNDPNK